GNRNIVRLLMASGFDPTDKDNQGNNALHWAAKGQNPEIVLDLLASNPNLINDRCIAWKSPLHLAAAWGNIGVVQGLLLGGAQVRATDDFGMTPLHYAAKQGDIQIVEMILRDRGVDVNAEDHLGRTPLYIACE
ncbi:ankyrin, partial [Tuber magnatum]